MIKEWQNYLAEFEKYLRVLLGLSPKTLAFYVSRVKAFFAWMDASIPGKQLEQITAGDVESFMEYCFIMGNKNCTRATKLIAIKKYFSFLVYHGVVKTNITAMIPKPKVPRTFVHKFSKDEVLNILRAIDIIRPKGIRDVVIVILAVFCGFRVSEIINLNIEDIIDDGKDLDINVINSKHGSNRVVYLWKAPALFVRQWLAIRIASKAESSAPLLVSYRKGGTLWGDGVRMTPVAIGKLVKHYASLAGVRKPRIHTHMFRATHASDLRSIDGYDVPAIADRLGHLHISSTDRYFPSRGRVSRHYRSLAEYWHEFPTLWTKQIAAEPANNNQEQKSV